MPLWVVLACHTAIGLGTPWPAVGASSRPWASASATYSRCTASPAETGGALCLYGATLLGIPVSTTYTITGSIMGVGASRGVHAVKWGVGARLVWSWLLTIPASAVVAAASWFLFNAWSWQ